MKFLILICLLYEARHAQADIFDLPPATIVQNRNYAVKNELTIQGAYLPLDPYNKYASAGLSFSHALSSFTSWEVVNGQYAFIFPSGLQKSIIEGFPPAAEEDFSRLQWIATTNLVLTPLYTKNLLFNSSLVHSQISFVGGAGAASFNKGTKACVDLGIIFRYFIGAHTSLKFDFRYFAFLAPETKNNLQVSVGLAYNFGSTDEPVDYE